MGPGSRPSIPAAVTATGAGDTLRRVAADVGASLQVLHTLAGRAELDDARVRIPGEASERKVAARAGCRLRVGGDG